MSLEARKPVSAIFNPAYLASETSFVAISKNSYYTFQILSNKIVDQTVHLYLHSLINAFVVRTQQNKFSKRSDFLGRRDPNDETAKAIA